MEIVWKALEVVGIGALGASVIAGLIVLVIVILLARASVRGENPFR
jgi:hypothetical protein